MAQPPPPERNDNTEASAATDAATPTQAEKFKSLVRRLINVNLDEVKERQRLYDQQKTEHR